jgi:hypothetical protein
MTSNEYKSHIIAERRRFPRKPLTLSLKFNLIPADASSVPEQNQIDGGRSENISAHGLALFSDLKMEKGQKLNIILYLPPKEKRLPELRLTTWREAECFPVEIESRVVWRLPFAGNKFAYGVEFMAVAEQDQAVFDEFLKDFYLQKPNLI